MNTTTIPTLAKILRALSVLFVSLGVFVIAIPLSSVLGTIKGVHRSGDDWTGFIHLAITLVIVGTVLFCGYRFSQHGKRGSLATALLWFFVLATGIYGAIFLFGLLRVMIQH